MTPLFTRYIFMPTQKKTWSLYGVPDELIKEVKKFAIDNNLTVGDAVALIIRQWMEFKSKENQK